MKSKRKIEIKEKARQFYNLRSTILMHVEKNPEPNGSRELIYNSSLLEFFQTIDELKELQIDFKYCVDLVFELKGTNRRIKQVPKIKSKLIESIDIKSVPEISIYCPEKKFFEPKLEFYVSPIPFNLDLDKNTFAYYEEYRTIDDMLDNHPFSRWFTVRFANIG